MSDQPKIAFQGEPGANTTRRRATTAPRPQPAACATFEDAFEAIRNGTAALGMIPVENSIAGRESRRTPPPAKLGGLLIIGESFKPIRFHLMANPGVALGQVKTVTSTSSP